MSSMRPMSLGDLGTNERTFFDAGLTSVQTSEIGSLLTDGPAGAICCRRRCANWGSLKNQKIAPVATAIDRKIAPDISSVTGSAIAQYSIFTMREMMIVPMI